MGFLDGGIAAVFGAAFGGLYLPGALHGTAGPVYAADGTITGWDDGEQPCHAQIDVADWSMQQDNGYVDGDVMIIVLTAGLTEQPTTDSEISVEAPMHALPGGGYQRWSVQSRKLDAAGSHWILRGRKAG